MRFFTPDLVVRFNSDDDGAADAADAEWEAAVKRYRDYLRLLRPRMPSAVQKLINLNLHDADLLAVEQAIEPVSPFPDEPSWAAVAILSVNVRGTVHSLLYALWDRLREHPAPADWPFSHERCHWLYDEIDAAGDRRAFWHRILLSDGRILEVPFTSVVVHTFSLEAADLPVVRGS